MSGLELELQGVGILDEATANARAMGMSLVEFLKMAIRNSYSPVSYTHLTLPTIGG